MENRKILTLGGKGKTGRRVAERLTKLGKTIRIGSRSENPSFDWENPETWAGALKGMNIVYITFQPDLAVPGFRSRQGTGRTGPRSGSPGEAHGGSGCRGDGGADCSAFGECQYRDIIV